MREDEKVFVCSQRGVFSLGGELLTIKAFFHNTVCLCSREGPTSLRISKQSQSAAQTNSARLGLIRAFMDYF